MNQHNIQGVKDAENTTSSGIFFILLLKNQLKNSIIIMYVYVKVYLCRRYTGATVDMRWQVE